MIFPNSESELKNWLKNDFDGNVVSLLLHEIEVTNSPSCQEYLTSTGSLKRKELMNKKKKKKKNFDPTEKSLLNDFN